MARSKPTLQRPFRHLARQVQLAPKAAPEPTPEPESPPDSFAQAARRMPIQPLKPATARIAPQKTRRARLPSEPDPASIRFEQTFDGKHLSGWRHDIGAGLLRQLHRCEPQACLDLHGHTLAEARRATHRFVHGQRRLGRRYLLIIVGRGTHSQDGHASLRTAVGDWLSEEAVASSVLGFATASRKHGGAGAVMIALAAPVR